MGDIDAIVDDRGVTRLTCQLVSRNRDVAVREIFKIIEDPMATTSDSVVFNPNPITPGKPPSRGTGEIESPQ